MRSKNAILNISSNLLLQFIIVLYGFIIPKVILNNYGSEINGLVSSITQFLAYISLLESGVGPVIKSLLYKPLVKKDKNTICKILKSSESFFKKLSIIFVFYIVVLSIIYPLFINSTYSFIFTLLLVIIISISMLIQYYFGITYQIFLQANQKNHIISFIQIVSYLMSVLIVIILSHMNCSIHILKLFSSIPFIIRPFIQNYYVKKKYAIDLKNIDANYKIEKKWDGFAQHISAVVHDNTDITILTIFSNLFEVSVYSVYSIVVKGLRAIMTAFSNGIDASFGNMLANNEHDNLKEKFNIYEVIYNFLVSIIFGCALVLIIPFIKLYTSNISDANYIRKTFGFLIVISELIWVARQPYNELVKSAGHFKETKKGAILECITNLSISIILVNIIGINGVMIGTIIATSIRALELTNHCNKNILFRTNWESIKKYLLLFLGVFLVYSINNKLQVYKYSSFLKLIFNGTIMIIIDILVLIVFNYMFYSKELKKFMEIIKNVFKRKEINVK